MEREMNDTEKKIASRLRSIEKLFHNDEAKDCFLLVHATGHIYLVDRNTEEELQHIYIGQCDCGDFDLGGK